MATYPTAVKTFTTKNDGAGNIIQASHINDLQDEITAIEDGLLNGTAPVNSSRITASASQITNSTVTNLSVTTASTIAELFVTKAPPSARVFSTVSQALQSGSLVELTFESQQFVSTSAMHSTGTNPARLIPPSSGVYLVTGHAAFNDNSSGYRLLELCLNSTTTIARHTVGAGAQMTDPVISLATMYKLETTDYVVLRAFQNSGSTGSIKAGATTPTAFTLTKIR